jgi:hypothetical protein
MVAHPFREFPLAFEPNVGQAESDTVFLTRGLGYTIQLERGCIVLRQGQGALRTCFEGAASAPTVRGLDPQNGKAHYLLGGRDQWRTNIPLYGRVEYDGIYPGIDIVFHGTDGQMEYDFRVAPGARVSQIGLSFAGQESVRIEKGDLVLKSAFGDVRHRKPRIYQERNGREIEIAGRFVLHGARQAKFEVGAYDSGRTLVVDPALVYATYIGGSGSDYAWAVAVDSAGCAYIAGETWPVSFPRTFSVSNTTGNQDAFLVKLNPSGTGIIYATYWGGPAGTRHAAWR